jgi:serine phosphatase RsbU (regulator of sigma subunit)
VTEAGMEGDNEYGEDRLIAKIREHQFSPAARMVHAIQEDVSSFSPGSRGDDVTVVAIRGT